MARRSWLVVSLAATLAVAGCSADAGGGQTADAGSGSAAGSATATPTPTPEAVVTVTPAASATGVAPDAPVSVAVKDGTLKAVSVVAKDGSALAGSAQGGQWRSAERMAPGQSYTVTVLSTRPDGSEQQDTSTFSTLQPAVVATYHVLYDKSTVGVGAPVTIQFDSAVKTKEQRAAIEKNAVVTTTPKVEGSWGWLDNRQLMWRPAEFWKPGTKISLVANLKGLQTGDDKWVGKSARSDFTIGSAMISTVDMKNHVMTVTRDGQVLRTVPVSTGKSTEERFITRSGTKVIIEKNGDMTMDSETVGIKKDDPNYYKLDTKWNMRVTWTGEFLHSAPWSVGAQGVANVSHGCINLAPRQAEWMFKESKVGDVIKFTGSTRPFMPPEGIGVWQYSYEDWKKQSALAP